MDDGARERARVIDDEFQTRIAKYDLSAEKILPIVVISVIVDMLGYTMVMPLLPFYAQSFGASDFMVGIIMSMNAVTSLVTGPLWARLSDRYGRCSNSSERSVFSDFWATLAANIPDADRDTMLRT